MLSYFFRQSSKVEDPEIDAIEELANDPSASDNLRRTLTAFFLKHELSDMAPWSRPKFINVLLKQNAWPVDEKLLVTNVSQNMKDKLIETFNEFTKVELKVGAMLQSLCKQTFLGQIFHRQLGWTKCTLISGHLNIILMALQNILKDVDIRTLTFIDSTRKALQQESVRENSTLTKDLLIYPNVNNLVTCLISSNPKDTESKDTELKLTMK